MAAQAGRDRYDRWNGWYDALWVLAPTLAVVILIVTEFTAIVRALCSLTSQSDPAPKKAARTRGSRPCREASDATWSNDENRSNEALAAYEKPYASNDLT